MGTEKEHGGILLKTVLGPVPMVYVPIDDEHPGEPVFLLDIARGDRHVIEETEPHRTSSFSMMSWRTDSTKDVLHLIGVTEADPPVFYYRSVTDLIASARLPAISLPSSRHCSRPVPCVRS